MSEKNLTTLGGRLAHYRRARGLTQTDVGNALGIKPQSVSAWEKDQAEPSINKIKLLADLFGVDVTKLIEQPPQSVRQVADNIEQLVTNVVATGQDDASLLKAADRYECAMQELKRAEQAFITAAKAYVLARRTKQT